MDKSFRSFKKELKAKKEQEETFQALNRAVETWKKRRDGYADKAKDALKRGDESQYRTSVALLKNAMFNLAQTEDMLTNFTIARDMREAQMLNKKYVKWFDSALKEVCKTCESVGVQSTGKLFEKALFKQSTVSKQMQEMLRSNNASFACSVDSLSDIDETDVRALLQTELKKDNLDLDKTLADMENEFLNVGETKTEKKVLVDGGSSAPAMPERPVERKEEPKFEKREEPKFEKREEPKFEPTFEKKEEPKFEPTFAKKEEPKFEKKEEKQSPEDVVLDGGLGEQTEFNWEELPVIGFSDIAGLQNVKEEVQLKVLLPLKNPEAFEGYGKKGGGGLCLYGPPGTGKTMIAAAIAHEIGAKFCSVKPSDLLRNGVGNTEKAVKALFAEARKFPCAVIYFDEMESLAPKNTHATHAKQLRSEFLAQLQGIDSYKKDNGNVLFLIAATNKPWDIDSAFLRPGRFGTRIYVGLPDAEAREYMLRNALRKVKEMGLVTVSNEIDYEKFVEATNGYNGSDISNLIDKIKELSSVRSIRTGVKSILPEDFDQALEAVRSTVQSADIQKLKEWREENNA